MSGATPASIALNELIATMQKLVDLRTKANGRDLTDQEDKRYSQLEDRIDGLEKQLQRIVIETLGIDYGVLWHAVTPSGPIPKLPQF